MKNEAGLVELVLALASGLGLTSFEGQQGVIELLQLFTLGLARWIPVFVFSPFLGGRLVPGPVKTGLAVLMALWMLPSLASLSGEVPGLSATLGWWVMMLREVVIGFVLAFGASLIFWAAEMGGRFLDSVRGTTTASLLIPQVSTQSTLLGDFFFQLFIVLYVTAGGHRWFLAGVFRSYELFPPLETGLGVAATAQGFVVATSGLFAVALQLVAPAVVVVFMVDLILGVANRMAPQLDVFFMGLSLKSAGAALAVSVSLYSIVALAPQLFRQHQAWLDATLITASESGPGKSR